MTSRREFLISTAYTGGAMAMASNPAFSQSATPANHNAAHQWRQKSTLFEESLRVPLIIAPPEAQNQGQTVSTPVSMGLDLYPTILDFAGVEPSRDLLGRGLGAVARDAASLEDLPVFSETTIGGLQIPGKQLAEGRSVRFGRFKYVLYNTGTHREQLFDLQTDPGEMSNLARCGAFAKQLQEGRRLLREWVETSQDYFFKPI